MHPLARIAPFKIVRVALSLTARGAAKGGWWHAEDRGTPGLKLDSAVAMPEVVTQATAVA
jgi:hypothetical protein